MKRILLTAMIVGTATLADAQQWIDITEKYVKNPTYIGNDYSYWEGTGLWGNGPKENAEHYNKTYDTYQDISGLKPGKYRVSLKAFYRMGSATQDYDLYKSGNYSSKQYAQLYAESSNKVDYNTPIVPLSSGKLKNGLGGNYTGVGQQTSQWWWPTYEYYVPDNMEAAYYWFEAGYYNNSVECEVAEDGKLRIGIRKSQAVKNDWTCIDDWKLEIWDFVTMATEVKMNVTTATMIPTETRQFTATVYPEEATYHNVTWKSSNSRVATVDQNGNVTAVALGTAVITATATDGSEVFGECTLTVESPATASSENIKINEIMSANVDVYRDPSTNFGSWVELYNPTDKGILLGGLYVTDDANNLKKHRLIDNYGALPAHGFAILNFDHFEVFTKDSYRQIDDKLDCDGGTIYLSDKSGQLITSEVYPEAMSRTAYARKGDGVNDWGWTATPTPGATNKTAVFASARLDAPVVSTGSQLLNGTLTFHVDIPEGATLRYTTNGSTPTLRNGETSLNGIFVVRETTVYRFAFFK